VVEETRRMKMRIRFAYLLVFPNGFICLQNNIAELLICIPAYVEEHEERIWWWRRRGG